VHSAKIWGHGLAICLAGALLAAGCGGGGGDDAPTKAEFIQQADAICKKAHDKFEKEFEQFQYGSGNERPSNAQLEKFAKTNLVPGTQGEIDDISALEPPSGDEAEVKAILDSVQGAVDKIKADPGILLPSVPEDPLAKGHRLAKEYGMKECAT
jgi:hypothetical protein